MNITYSLTLIDNTETIFQCEIVEVTDATVTGINAAREIVFVVPVSQVKSLFHT